MIVSNSRRFVFCHLHKTAGEAVTEALAAHLGWNDVVLGVTPLGIALDRPYEARFGLHKHSPAADIRAVIGAAVWDDYLTFSVVRHPFDRVRSLHAYLGVVAARQNGGGLRRRLAWLRKDPRRPPWRWPSMQARLEAPDFSGFIRHPKFLSSAAARPQAAALGAGPALATQEAGARPAAQGARGADGPAAAQGADDSRAAQGADGAIIVRRVLRFERLAEDFAALTAALDLPPTALPRRNASGGAAAALPAADRAHLAQVYAADLAAFGYSADAD